MNLDLAPHIVRLTDGRRIGYRRFGEGPPVVLLHASPRSSLAMLPLGLRLAQHFTLYAFDSPGFGWSDPLALSRPDAADFGDALIAAFDAVGLAQAPIYGSHTGAAIAVAACLRHPGRVPALALDGYAMFTPAEQAELLATYLAPIRPSWDGTHLAFLWSRMRDQFTVFPWHHNGQATRLQRARPPLGVQQAVIVDFLAAGDHYRAGYAAAFRFDGGDALRRLTVPTRVMSRVDDVLYPHLDALGELPDCVRPQRLPADDIAWAEAVRAALTCAYDPSIAAATGTVMASDRHMLRVPGGCIGVIDHAGPGRPIVLLPGIPGSARGEDALARALGRRVLAVDLPGIAGSVLPGDADAAAIAASIHAAVLQLGIAACDVVGLGESAAIAGMVRERCGGGLVLVDPVPDADRAAMIEHMTDVTPRREGGHLLAAWHQLRDAGLWRPWFRTDPAHAIPNGSDPDVPRLQDILTDWMRGGNQIKATLAAALAPPLPDAPLVLLPHHPWSALHLARSAARGLRAREVADDRHARAAAILGLLDA